MPGVIRFSIVKNNFSAGLNQNSLAKDIGVKVLRLKEAWL
jgi:hypothetical protein